MIEALAKGDEVATAGGLLGKVTKMGDTYLGLEIANGVEVRCSAAPWCRCCPRAPSSKIREGPGRFAASRLHAVSAKRST
jgi:hypothetical protein